MDNENPIETKRLILSPTNREDAAFVLELVNTPKWIEHIGDRKVYTIDDAVKYIEDKMLPQYERLGYGNYTISRKSDGVKLGTCGLYDREGLEGVDIGYALLTRFEKKGYAYEAVNKLKETAIHTFHLDSLNAITVDKNTASKRLLDKLGFKYVKRVKIPNDDELLLLYVYSH